MDHHVDWYDQLAKPAWTPTGDTISLIWRILYPIIVATFLFVFVQACRGRLPKAVVLPFVINLIANLLFTPLMFQLQSLVLASIDILIVLGTIPLMMVAVWPHYRWVAFAQLPYLVWVAIATVLQLSITAMNW